MSGKPPSGPPPPYSYSYVYPSSSHQQKPSTVPAYTYVPTQMMVPVPMPVQPVYQPPPHHPHPPHPPQPTYVTNYVYQPPQPEPISVEVSDVVVHWESTTSSTASSLAHKAFIGGNEGDNGLWVIRAHHCGDLVPGKFSVKTSSASIPHGGKEVPVHSFEVLLAAPHMLHWKASNHGQVPLGAFPAGHTSQGEPLYIARAKHTNTRLRYSQLNPYSMIPGKVHPSHSCCYISSGGSEVSYKNYEVLCKVIG